MTSPNFEDAERELQRVEERERLRTRTCIDCKHWLFDGGSPDYSEVTPGCDATSSCDLDHWEMEHYESERSFREKLLKARTCKDFEDYQEPKR